MDKYTSFHPKKGDSTPYVTLWVRTSGYVTRERDPNDEWDRDDTAEELEGCGVCLGYPKSSYDLGRSRCLSFEQLGFQPTLGDDGCGKMGTERVQEKRGVVWRAGLGERVVQC